MRQQLPNRSRATEPGHLHPADAPLLGNLCSLAFQFRAILGAAEKYPRNTSTHRAARAAIPVFWHTACFWSALHLVPRTPHGTGSARARETALDEIEHRWWCEDFGPSPLEATERRPKLSPRLLTVKIEFRPDHSVVGGSGSTTRFKIHVTNAAGGNKRSVCQNVIDTPAPIMHKSVSEVVPIRVLHPIRVEPAKHISESPSIAAPKPEYRPSGTDSLFVARRFTLHT
jgi:hypothetical protein